MKLISYPNLYISAGFATVGFPPPSKRLWHSTVLETDHFLQILPVCVFWLCCFSEPNQGQEEGAAAGWDLQSFCCNQRTEDGHLRACPCALRRVVVAAACFLLAVLPPANPSLRRRLLSVSSCKPPRAISDALGRFPSVRPRASDPPRFFCKWNWFCFYSHFCFLNDFQSEKK